MKNKNFFKINLIYFTAILSVAVLFVLSYFGFIVNEWLSSFLIQIIVMTAIPLLMYTLLISKKYKTTLNDIGFNKISAKTLLIVILLGFLLYFLNSYIATFFNTVLTLFGYEKLPIQSTPTTINSATILKEFLLTALLPGICEEILHRGIMLNAAKKVYNTRFCLIVSSILFGLTHLNITQFFYAAILGYFMGYLNLVTNSIYPSIIVHFMNNFLSIYFTYGTALDWPFAKLVNTIEMFFSSNIFLFIACTAFGIILILTLYQYFTKQLLKERVNSDLQKLVNSLKLNQVPLIEAQIRIAHANRILKDKKNLFNNKEKLKANYFDKIFLVSSFVLGILITSCSFIWGII